MIARELKCALSGKFCQKTELEINWSCSDQIVKLFDSMLVRFARIIQKKKDLPSVLIVFFLNK